jgi:hypothetical protein
MHVRRTPGPILKPIHVLAALVLAGSLEHAVTHAQSLESPAEATHMTPPPQPPVAVIPGRDLAAVREIFNRDSDRPRILTLLSPT